MSRINTRTDVPHITAPFWTGAVGADESLVDGVSGLCARILWVAQVGAGPLNVTEAGGVARAYSAAEINAMGGVLRGNFESLVAAGSVSYDVTAGW